MVVLRIRALVPRSSQDAPNALDIGLYAQVTLGQFIVNPKKGTDKLKVPWLTSHGCPKGCHQWQPFSMDTPFHFKDMPVTRWYTRR